MKLTLTVQKVLEIRPSLEKFLKKELPSKILFRYYKTMKVFMETVDSFNEIRDQKLKEYGDPLPEIPGRPPQFNFATEEAKNNFANDMETLLKEEVVFEDVTLIKQSDIEEANIELTFEDLSKISDFVDFDS